MFVGLMVLAGSAVAAPLKLVGYVPNWIDTPGFAGSIAYSNLTHLNLAFENPTNAAGDLSFQARNAAIRDQAKAQGVQVLISIGGGGAAENPVLQQRYAALMAPSQRESFARNLARYLDQHGFDGLDVDIEGPSITGDYGSFIGTLAEVLRPRGKLLTAALSKGYGGDRVPSAALPHFDFVNIMAYDATGPWSPKTPGQHSSLEFARESITYWLGRGLSRSKAVLGVPFYGYGFGTAFRNRDYPYSEIVNRFPGAEQRDESGSTIWYNGIPTLRAKARYVLEADLAGMMVWSLDGDALGSSSLLTVLHNTLNGGKP